MDPKQLRHYVVIPRLKALGGKYATKSGIRIVMATTAQETHCGRWLVQLGASRRGKGICQMQPGTLTDLYENGLGPRRSLLPPKDVNRLIYDLGYAVQTCRLEYFRYPDPLPDPDDIQGMWDYYKKHWNSAVGAADRVQFEHNWHTYVVPH